MYEVPSLSVVSVLDFRVYRGEISGYFQDEWLDDPELKEWLQKVIQGPFNGDHVPQRPKDFNKFGFCKYCEKQQSAKLSTLKSHAKSKNHASAKKTYFLKQNTRRINSHFQQKPKGNNS